MSVLQVKENETLKTDSKRDLFSTIKRYRRQMGPQAWERFFPSLIFALLSGILYGLALMALLPLAYTLATKETSLGLGFWQWIIVVAVLGLGVMILDFQGTRLSYVGTLNFMFYLHELIGTKVAKLPLGSFTAASSAKLSRMVTQEMMSLGQSLAHFIYQMVSRIAATIVVVLATWVWDWRLGLLLSISIPLLMGVQNLSLRLIDRGKAISEPAELELAHRVVEFARCQGALRATNAGANYRQLDEAFENNRKASYKALWIEAVGNLLSGGFIQVIVAVMIMVTGLAALDGTWPPLVAIGVIGLALRFTTVLEEIVTSAVGSQERREIMAQIDEVIQAPELSQPPVSLPLTSVGEVCLENVNFSYEAGIPVLRQVSFQVPSGSMCALVGPSGCGKTTIAKLVARFMDTDSGQVKVGGVPVGELATKDLMSQLSMVFQDVYLFDDTLAANIRLGRPEASEEEILWAAKLAGVSEIVSRLPEGWNSRVGEGGKALSGGERQRVSIARALLKKAPIVLFDEATSALDAENEANIVAAMNELRTSSTLIVIAHKLETIRSAEQIVVLNENGEIAQIGTHEKLLASPGPYEKFWRSRSQAVGWSIV